MLSAIGTSATRTAAVIPAVIIVVFAGVLWLLGLLCGSDRRNYVIVLSQQAMDTVGMLLRGTPNSRARKPRPADDIPPARRRSLAQK